MSRVLKSAVQLILLVINVFTFAFGGVTLPLMARKVYASDLLASLVGWKGPPMPEGYELMPIQVAHGQDEYEVRVLHKPSQRHSDAYISTRSIFAIRDFERPKEALKKLVTEAAYLALESIALDVCTCVIPKAPKIRYGHDNTCPLYGC